MNPFCPISLQASLILQVPQVIYKRGINTTVGDKVKQSLLSPSVSNSEKNYIFFSERMFSACPTIQLP